MHVAINKRITVVSTPRSGHHAIANWILRQHQGVRCMFTAAVPQERLLQPTDLAYAYEHWWYDDDSRGYRDEERLANCIDYSVVLDCYERETFEQIQNYYAECPTNYVINIRNIFNTIAGMIKRRPEAPFFNIEVWKSLARIAVRDKQEVSVVLFDRWHVDKAYRKSIAKRLGFEFTDKGRAEVMNIGYASSFDLDALDGKAHKMDVLNRYKSIINHPTVIKKVLSDPEAVELNRQLFGETYSI